METLIRDALKDFDTFKELTETIPLEVLSAEASGLSKSQQQVFREYSARLNCRYDYRLIRQNGRTLFLEALSPDKKAVAWFRERFGCDLIIDADYAIEMGLAIQMTG
jgi:hypothetical protein